MKLVDTSAWVEYLRRSSHPIHLEVKKLIESGEAAWCGIVALELANFVSADQEAALAKVHRAVWMVEIDEMIWSAAFKLATTARRKGVTVPLPDLIVFCCSKLYDLPVLHKGDTDFGRLETVYGAL